MKEGLRNEDDFDVYIACGIDAGCDTWCFLRDYGLGIHPSSDRPECCREDVQLGGNEMIILSIAVAVVFFQILISLSQYQEERRKIEKENERQRRELRDALRHTRRF